MAHITGTTPGSTTNLVASIIIDTSQTPNVNRVAVDTNDANEFITKIDVEEYASLLLSDGAASTVVSTWTVTALKSGRLEKVVYGGTRSGKFLIKINGSTKYAPESNGPGTWIIPFDRRKLSAGDVVTVEAENDSNKTATYHVTIAGYEV